VPQHPSRSPRRAPWCMRSTWQDKEQAECTWSVAACYVAATLPARLIIGLVETDIEKIRVAKTLAELAIAARLVARKMRQLAKQGRVVGLGRRARRGADTGLARGQL